MTSKVRNQVFETNSSSTHSLTIAPEEIINPRIPAQALRNGVLVIHPGEYGWEWRRYYRLENKLSYLLTQVAGSAFENVTIDPDFTERLKDKNDNVRNLFNTVEHTTGCRIEIESPSGDDSLWAYVDHDSQGVGFELLDDNKALFSFLFSDKSFVQTGNDNTPCGEFIRTDFDEKERFYAGLYTAEAPGDIPLKLRLGTYSDRSLIIDTPTTGRIMLPEVSHRADHKISDALDGAVCVGGTVVGEIAKHTMEYWPKTKPLPAAVSLKEQKARDMAINHLAYLNREADEENGTPAVSIKLLEGAQFSGVMRGKDEYQNDFTFGMEYLVTPEILEKVTAAVADINEEMGANASKPGP